ncbi:DUF6880 family protein, partial [Rubellimicrobium roseum]
MVVRYPVEIRSPWNIEHRGVDACKTTLNSKNREALGAQRLAELLIELSTGDAAAKRRLRLELAGTA